MPQDLSIDPLSPEVKRALDRYGLFELFENLARAEAMRDPCPVRMVILLESPFAWCAADPSRPIRTAEITIPQLRHYLRTFRDATLPASPKTP